jgi:hypothetical protein
MTSLFLPFQLSKYQVCLFISNLYTIEFLLIALSELCLTLSNCDVRFDPLDLAIIREGSSLYDEQFVLTLTDRSDEYRVKPRKGLLMPILICFFIVLPFQTGKLKIETAHSDFINYNE